ncbi:MAG: hypothetical protein J5822_07810 [Eubacteriaceae bacterium]|nr:hypothetical protein [Eubacteriaceae bacterium]
MSTLLDYKCPACNGRLEFDSASQKLKCPFCDSEYALSDFEGRDEKALDPGEAALSISWDTAGIDSFSGEEASQLTVFVCDSCGGEIVTDRTTGATSCPFCDSPVVVPRAFEGGLRPDSVIPFRLDKAAAKQAFSKHLQGKKLLPRVFRTQNHIDEIKGVYIPFWLFDCDVKADITYRATKEEEWKEDGFDCVDTSYFDVQRQGSISFAGVPVCGSTKVSPEMMESLEPYGMDEAQPFKSAYLAGYMADRYDIPLDSSLPRATARVKRSTEDAFASTLKDYRTKEATETSLDVTNARARYALFPVWLLNTTWRGNRYTFAMNGQTGKFVGDLPEDKSIASRWFWGLGHGLAAVIYVVSQVAYYL